MRFTKNADNSTPYRTNKGGKIEAPCKQKDEPKATKVQSGRDLRGGK